MSKSEEIISKINTEMILQLFHIAMSFEIAYQETGLMPEQTIYLRLLSNQLQATIDFVFIEYNSFKETLNNENMDCVVYLDFLEEKKQLEDILNALTNIKIRIDAISGSPNVF